MTRRRVTIITPDRGPRERFSIDAQRPILSVARRWLAGMRDPQHGRLDFDRRERSLIAEARAAMLDGRSIDTGVVLAIAADADGRDWLRALYAVAREDRASAAMPGAAPARQAISGTAAARSARDAWVEGWARQLTGRTPASEPLAAMLRAPKPWERGGQPAR